MISQPIGIPTPKSVKIKNHSLFIINTDKDTKMLPKNELVRTANIDCRKIPL